MKQSTIFKVIILILYTQKIVGLEQFKLIETRDDSLFYIYFPEQFQFNCG